MCLLFYYEAQNKYIHFVYKIGKIKWEKENQISGDLFEEIVNNNALKNENSNDICNELLCIQLIELVSDNISFSLLFHPFSYSWNSFKTFDRNPHEQSLEIHLLFFSFSFISCYKNVVRVFQSVKEWFLWKY